MEEQKDKKAEEGSEKKRKKEGDKLPYCTTAPSAEHARADQADEPCDDNRAGK